MQTSPTRVAILDVQISRYGFEETIQACKDRIFEGLGGYVCFANVHTVTESQNNAELHRCLNEAFLSVADGLPLVWISRTKSQPIRSRVCGPDFMAEFLRKFPDHTHGFIGGAPGQAEKLASLFGIQPLCYSPPMRAFSAPNALEDWNTFLKLCPGGQPPQFVWIGLGAPKQELWMNAISALAPKTLFFGVGAAFDFLTQTKRRAPLWMQKSGTEWLFRFAQEPRRLWKRYLVYNTVFVSRVVGELIRGRS